MRKFATRTLLLVGIIHAAITCRGESALPDPLPCSKWVRFEIVLGRLTASRPRCRKNQRFTIEEPQAGVHEVLTFASQGQAPCIQWQRTEPASTFCLQLESGDVVSLRSSRTSSGKRVSLEYQQPKTGPISFSVQSADQETEYKADSLWHLFLLAPETCSQHLMPLLERLRPHWNLDIRSKQFAVELLKLAERDWHPNHQRIEALVEDLASDHFQTRNKADHALRAYGFSALSHLRVCETRRLSLEQKKRIQKIQQHLDLEAGDTAFRAARWLSEDKEIWLSLLAHGQASVRQTAAIRLSKLCNRPIKFDPHAPGNERQGQIEKLSHLLATD